MLAIVGSILGAFLLLFVIFRCCVPGGRIYDLAKRVGGELSAKMRGRNEAEDENTSVNESRGKVEMRGV